MGRAKKRSVSKKNQHSKKPISPTVYKEKRMKLFASFFVDRILEEQRKNLLFSKDHSDKDK